MAYADQIFKVLLVLVAGYLLTTSGIPRLFVGICRLFGFAMKMSPITRKRIQRFRRIRRGYWSFQAILTLFVVSLFLELLVNGKALMIRYEDKLAFPAVTEWVDRIVFFRKISSFQKASDFGQIGESEVDYRTFARWATGPKALQSDIEAKKRELADRKAAIAGQPQPRPYDLQQIRSVEEEIARLGTTSEVFAKGRASCWMPVYPVSPSDLRHDLSSNPPNAPSISQGIPLGTDLSGRDVLPLMLYGFRISLAFALIVATFGYFFGIIVGGIQGYYGGWTDIVTQRVEEIWGSIPFLFTIMIIASIMQPSFLLLAVLLIMLRSWLGITFYVRGEFYREKAKDYVQAAIGSGVSDWKIITRHILPNALVPVVTFAPFGIVAYIGSLVSLDYLGFGLPPGTPSWGSLLRQGLENVKFYPHLTIVPVVALALTLYAVVMVGEAVREAFDPKVFSRLR